MQQLDDMFHGVVRESPAAQNNTSGKILTLGEQQKTNLLVLLLVLLFRSFHILLRFLILLLPPLFPLLSLIFLLPFVHLSLLFPFFLFFFLTKEKVRSH